jgi:hypothetical protein
MLSGEFERALANLDACLSFDASRFHLSILTKQVGACIKAAHICAIADEEHKAAQYLRDGAALGRKICAADPDALFGTLEDPRFFHYGELAEVLSLSSRCAFGYEQWRRGGRDALRMALASSTDLFRAPRAGDLRDMALQKEIIGRQSECIRILQATTGMGFCERLARMALRLFKGKALARSRRK